MGIGKRLEDNQVEKGTEEDLSLITAKYSLADLILPFNTETSIADFLSYKKHEQLIFNEWGLSQAHKHQRQTAVNFYGAPGMGKLWPHMR